jgi:hypothetical protein
VTSSDQGLSFPEERAWERGWWKSGLSLAHLEIKKLRKLRNLKNKN